MATPTKISHNPLVPHPQAVTSTPSPTCHALNHRLLSSPPKLTFLKSHCQPTPTSAHSPSLSLTYHHHADTTQPGATAQHPVRSRLARRAGLLPHPRASPQFRELPCLQRVLRSAQVRNTPTRTDDTESQLVTRLPPATWSEHTPSPLFRKRRSVDTEYKPGSPGISVGPSVPLCATGPTSHAFHAEQMGLAFLQYFRP